MLLDCTLCRPIVAALEPGRTVVRKGFAAAVVLVVLAMLAGFVGGVRVGQASERDETIMTVHVSSADHEILEGYFTLGENATVMAKPGSDLHKFLSRQRGRKVKVTLTEAAGPELSRLVR